MQVDPIKPVLKGPKTKRLKQKVDESLSSFAFKFNLRRYTEGVKLHTATLSTLVERCKVGQCRLTL